MNEIAYIGKVRGLNTDLQEEVGSEKIQIALSGQGEQLVAFAAAQCQEPFRQSRSFWSNNLPAAPIAAVTSIPTTAYILAIWNCEDDSGRSYVIDYVWAHFVVIPAAQCHMGIIGCLGQVRDVVLGGASPVPTVAQNVGVIRASDGTGGKDTKCRVTLSGAPNMPATSGIAANWFPIGDSINTAVVSLPGMAQFVPVNGRIIVPPGRVFAVHVLSSVTTTTSIMGIGWTEKQLILG